MTFQPKKISAKIKAGGIGGFNPMNSDFVMTSFKLRSKRFRSVPKGFLAIQPDANTIYAGFDYNGDGVINVTNEAFARFLVQINPFDTESKTATERLADKFSNPKAKGRLVFKKMDLGDVVVFESKINKETLTPAGQMFNGKVVNGTFTYDALIDTLMNVKWHFGVRTINT